MTQLRQKKEPPRSGGGEREDAYRTGVANFEALLGECAATRLRTAQVLRTSIVRLEGTKGPLRMQKRREEELKLLKQVTELLMTDQVERIEKTPGWVKMLGNR